MRLIKFLLFTVLLFGSTMVSAAEIITLTDGSTIDANVLEVTETVIKYRKSSNPSGPIYSIAVNKVGQIKYENGLVDRFNAIRPTDNPTSSRSASDDALIREYERRVGSQDNTVSDAQLLRIMTIPSQSEQLRKKAKKYRLTGWIGGGIFVAAGATVGTILIVCEYGTGGAIGAIGAGVGVGTLWALGFNLKANSLVRQAKEMEAYSLNLYECEPIKIGDNSSMTAGVGMIGNQRFENSGLGINLKFNF